MKKLIIAIAALGFAYQTSHAQTEKGDQTLGANLSYQNINGNQSNINTPNAYSTVSDTSYSYFIADKLDIGTNLQYSSQVNNNTQNADGQKQNDYDYGGSVFIRKYFMYANKIGIRTGPYVAYYHDDSKITAEGPDADPGTNTDIKNNNYQAGFNLDLVYYPSKCLGLSAMLANVDYDHYTSAGTPDALKGSGNNFNFNFINNGLSLSVFYVFGGK